LRPTRSLRRAEFLWSGLAGKAPAFSSSTSPPEAQATDRRILGLAGCPFPSSEPSQSGRPWSLPSRLRLGPPSTSPAHSFRERHRCRNPAQAEGFSGSFEIHFCEGTTRLSQRRRDPRNPQVVWSCSHVTPRSPQEPKGSRSRQHIPNGCRVPAGATGG
jgi:hypothetical protein